jgi:hypothetical protein
LVVSHHQARQGVVPKSTCTERRCAIQPLNGSGCVSQLIHLESTQFQGCDPSAWIASVVRHEALVELRRSRCVALSSGESCRFEVVACCY